ncbi:hypothetical protein MUU48_04285 [Scandinavium sp. H11S7]|uniref:hypothetical protein n=1 Tax=Scandinavium hiltneri TaxID=2926519 RepID=UPI0021669D92|nr:hypothetical protein [Scandinavium hiltneri]MCS2156148.1 hypothetical protein [Scandinavium hiltneri]
MPELQPPDIGAWGSNKVSVDRKEKNKRPEMVQNYNLRHKSERKVSGLRREREMISGVNIGVRMNGNNM